MNILIVVTGLICSLIWGFVCVLSHGLPPLSEERRRDLVKSARKHGEDAKIAIRNIRRHAKDDIKSTQEEEHLSEDMRYLAEDKLQEDTNTYVGKIDKILERKEEEIMEV